MNNILLKKYLTLVMVGLVLSTLNFSLNAMHQPFIPSDTNELRQNEEPIDGDALRDNETRRKLIDFCLQYGMTVNEAEHAIREGGKTGIAFALKAKIENEFNSANDEERARLEGRRQAWAKLEAQTVLSERSLTEIIKSGAMAGVEQGTAQVVASLIVELTQLGILKGVEYFYRPDEKQLRDQQMMEELDKAEKQFQTLLSTIRTSGPMITTLVEGSITLNDEEAKKMAALALIKYGAQVNLALEMNNLQLQSMMSGTMPS